MDGGEEGEGGCFIEGEFILSVKNTRNPQLGQLYHNSYSSSILATVPGSNQVNLV